MKWLTKKAERPRREIPEPTGPHPVGCTDIMTSYDPSGVFIRLFYPAEMVEDAKPPEWLPHKSYLQGYAMFFKVWPPLFCKYFPKFVGDIHIPAAWDAPPLRLGDSKFPVLVFSHGLGGCRTSYTTLCLELASQGYVVAAIEHRDYSACMSYFYEKSNDEKSQQQDSYMGSVSDKCLRKHWMLFQKVKQGKKEYTIRNKQVHQRAKECSSALDLLCAMNNAEPVENILDTSLLPLKSFQGLLDTQKASVGGHSFGGATVIATMASDKRFKAGVGLDTWMLPLQEEVSTFQKVDQPMLFINMEKFQTKANLKVMSKMESNKIERTIITLKGTVHLNQCDVPFLCDRTMRRLFGAHSHLNRFTAMDLTTKLSAVFLAQHLDLPTNDTHMCFLTNHQKEMEKGIRLT